MKHERVTCSVCGKSVAGHTPKGGDGSVLFAFRHRRAGGSLCPGTYRPGVYTLVAAAEREVIRVAEASHTGGDGCALCEAVAALRRAREGK